MNAATILDLVSSLAVLAGLVFAVAEVRQYRTSREYEVALAMLQSMQTPDFIKALRMVYALPENLSRGEVEERLGDDAILLYTLMTTWESLGIFVYRRHLGLGLVDDFFSGSIAISWRKLERYVREERAAQDRPTLLEWFQWLAERMREREADTPPLPAYEAEKDWKPER